MATYKSLDAAVNNVLQEGVVIPAHPLALTKDLKLDEARQRLLTKYYIASGAGGIAVGVHTTQFAIRKPGINLFEPVLKIAADEIERAELQSPFIKVAGICGPVEQAINEASLAVKHGYHLGLLSNGGLQQYTEAELIERAYAVAEIMPLFGFYLQPAAGGRLLSYDFWRRFVEIPNVYAIKVAAFNRYQTLDVVRAVCNSERRNGVALYTGNDDNIVADLLTPYHIPEGNSIAEKRFVGGLLGHWAVWTKKATTLLGQIKQCVANDYAGAAGLLSEGIAITDMNAAIFDVKHQFHGCIPGIHEVLRRQGLLEGTWCLDPGEQLSEGQSEEINRVCKNYPNLIDDAFVETFLRNNKA
ncbi:MAG TPA: dihydrodipicolinate synthase family protein [Panacibacter sp.]|nr:dihydrodipicolinate synthase family protein [Panacibacter sp.]HNP44355.1 dihydrodipicolinate synthase family protein [Panacibacter sp.]